MGKLGDAFVTIQPDLRPLEKGLVKAESLTKSFVARGTATLAGLGAGIATGALAYSLGRATIAAGNLEESVSKVNATFGKQGGQILKFADDMAEKYGKVKQATIDAAVGFGLLGLSVGLASGKSAKLGIELATLATDIESFANVPFEDVARALKSGLTGEAEPMRQFGVFLSEDAVKMEALRMSGGKLNGVLTEQQKVMARLSLIKNNPAIQKAMGDLERTQDSSINQLRKFQGDIENLRVSIGKNLIDPMIKGIGVARELGTVLDKTFNGKGQDPTGKAGEAASALLGGLQQAIKDPIGFVKDNWNALPGMAGGDEARKKLQDQADKAAGVKHLGGGEGFDQTKKQKDNQERINQGKIRDAKIADAQVKFNKAINNRKFGELAGGFKNFSEKVEQSPIGKFVKLAPALLFGKQTEKAVAGAELGKIALGANEGMGAKFLAERLRRQNQKELEEPGGFKKTDKTGIQDLWQSHIADQAENERTRLVREEENKKIDESNEYLKQAVIALNKLVDKPAMPARAGGHG